MTLRLTVDRAAWRAHVGHVVTAAGAVVPVVKGNGYGFGCDVLVRECSAWTRQLAVGTLHEAADLVGRGWADRFEAVHVLTPGLHVPDELRADSGGAGRLVATVAAPAHVDALRAGGWRGRVDVKLASSMRRYGVDPPRLAELMEQVRRAGFDVATCVLHPPLHDAAHPARARDELEAWLAVVDPSLEVSVSHLPLADLLALRERHPSRRLSLRLGTTLWHGDKSFLHLAADVLDARPIGRDTSAGYRLVRVTDGGTLLMIGAGSAHGVTPLDGGLSPFHFHRERLTLLEPPHMHTSMALAGARHDAPSIGDWVDVQRPLITVAVDEIRWR